MRNQRLPHRMRYGCMAIVLFVLSCDSRRIQEPIRSTPQENAPFLISNARLSPSNALAGPRGGSPVSAAPAIATAPVAYLSLPPGSLPGALTATIRSAAGQFIRIDMVDGGFDPVAVNAAESDSVVVTVTFAGATPRVFHLHVPAKSPPKIVRTSPIKFKRDVVLNARMIVVFSEPVDTSALDRRRITVQHRDTAVNGTLQFADPAHTTVEFTPTAPLAPQTDYELRVTQSVRDLDGTTLDAAETIIFTTAAAPPPPPPPVQLPDTGGLRLMRSTPERNNVSVSPIDPRIELWFSQMVLNTSLRDERLTHRIVLMQGTTTVSTSLVCRIFIQTRCSSVAIVPREPLLPETNYEVVIRDGLVGAFGALLPRSVVIPFATEQPRTGPMEVRLVAESFTMLEYKYPGYEGWFYAPQLRVKESTGLGEVIIDRITLSASFISTTRVCSGNVRVGSGGREDLFSELYGDFELSFNMKDVSQRAPPDPITAVVHYSDTHARTDSLVVKGAITPGALPTTYTGGNGHLYNTSTCF